MNKTPPTTEIEIWQRFKSGDEEAFGQIYQQYVGILYNYGYHITTDSFLVQDAIQDLFVDLWRMRQNLSDTTSIKFYLFRALRRKLHRLVESEQIFIELTQNPLFSSPAYESIQIANEESTERLLHLQSYLQTLPPRQFEVIRLRFFEEFSFDQIAGIMDMNEQSVRNLIQRAILKLRTQFKALVSIVLILFFF